VQMSKEHKRSQQTPQSTAVPRISEMESEDLQNIYGMVDCKGSESGMMLFRPRALRLDDELDAALVLDECAPRLEVSQVADHVLVDEVEAEFEGQERC